MFPSFPTDGHNLLQGLEPCTMFSCAGIHILVCRLRLFTFQSHRNSSKCRQLCSHRCTPKLRMHNRFLLRLISSVVSCSEGVCLRQYDGFSYCQPIILPAVGSLLRQCTVDCWPLQYEGRLSALQTWRFYRLRWKSFVFCLLRLLADYLQSPTFKFVVPVRYV